MELSKKAAAALQKCLQLKAIRDELAPKARQAAWMYYSAEQGSPQLALLQADYESFQAKVGDLFQESVAAESALLVALGLG